MIFVRSGTPALNHYSDYAHVNPSSVDVFNAVSSTAAGINPLVVMLILKVTVSNVGQRVFGGQPLAISNQALVNRVSFASADGEMIAAMETGSRVVAALSGALFTVHDSRL